MADQTERIFNLPIEDDVQNAVVMSDKLGRPKAKQTPLNLFTLKTDSIIQEITDAAFKDLNYEGWATLQGCAFLSSLGSDLVNAPFTPVPANTYLITTLNSNIDTKIHKISYWFQSSGSDFGGKNRQFSRMGTNLTNAILAGFTEYTISPFDYVSGIQQLQDTSAVNITNTTGNYIDTGLELTITELSPDSTFRFDFSFLTQGTNANSKVQYRLLENGVEILETAVTSIGNTKISNSFSVLITSHSAVNPSTFTVEFKNVDAQINLLGAEKPLSMILTEVYQTTR